MSLEVGPRVYSFLFSLLFLMMGFFFLFVAAWAAYGIYSLLRASKQSRKYLEAARAEEPLQLSHLSAPLRKLVEDTRLLRVSLEAPVRDIGYFLEGDINRNADDLDSFDNMLMDVTRQLADWVMMVERLSDYDRDRMTDLGATPSPIRLALEEEGWSFERRNVERVGRPTMDTRLKTIIEQLAKFESALQLQPAPYR